MISLENKKLEKQKSSLLCKTHKSKITRSGRKKVDMRKAEHIKDKKNSPIRSHRRKKTTEKTVV